MRTVLAFVTLVSLSFAQADRLPRAQVSTYGNGCGVYGEPPFPASIVVQGLPVLGQTVTISYHSPVFTTSRFWRTPFLVAGLSRTMSRNGLPLPFYLNPLGYPRMGGNDCYVLSSDEFTAGFSGHVFAYYLPIPNDSRLVGMQLYLQWYIWYVVSGNLIFDYWVVTDGAMLTLGYSERVDRYRVRRAVAPLPPSCSRDCRPRHAPRRRRPHGLVLFAAAFSCGALWDRSNSYYAP